MKHDSASGLDYLVRPGWANYVVPSKQLKAELEKHRHRLNAVYGMTEEPDVGWVAYLSNRASLISRGKLSADTLKRRIHDVMYDTSVVTQAEIADALLLAAGVMLDADTSIQTFPGNMKAAIEMVVVRRADAPQERVADLATKLLDYRDKVLYPKGYAVHKMEAMEAKAA